MGLDISIDGRGTHRTTLHFSGRLDAETFGEADRTLDDVLAGMPAKATLVFDFTQLAYISSGGLRSVFRARKLAKDRGGQVILLNLQPQVRKVFDVVKAVPVSEVFASEAELEAYLDNLQRRITEEDDGF